MGKNRQIMQILCCLLLFSLMKGSEGIPEGKVNFAMERVLEYGASHISLEEASEAITAASQRIRDSSQTSLAWPCNERESLALAADVSSKQYTFTSQKEEMMVFSSGGGTVTEVSEGRIVISHGNQLETMYEGCTAVFVQPLQKVRRGELIGSVEGEGGDAELWFQIRKEQEPVDIGEYLW